jgi:hypothetical protein
MKQDWVMYNTLPKDWKQDKVNTYTQLLSAIQTMELELTSIQQQTKGLLDRIQEEAKKVII